MPTLDYLFEMRAAWDLLNRPDGMSIRRLRRRFTRSHGAPSSMWLSDLQRNHGTCFELFIPHRRPLRPVWNQKLGIVHTQIKRIHLVRPLLCTRDGPLGNPYPVAHGQDPATVCAACDRLMFTDGSAEALPARPLIVSPTFGDLAAALRRVAALHDIATYVAQGGDVQCICSRSCAIRRRADAAAPCHIFGVAAAIRARAALIQEVRSPIRPVAASYRAGSFLSSRRDPFRFIPASASITHIRRACPPIDRHLCEVQPIAAPRLSAALSRVPRTQEDQRGVHNLPETAFAGARPADIQAIASPSAFSHRRMEPCPDAEVLLLSYTIGNRPPLAPVDDPPPSDQPVRVADQLSDVIKHDTLRKVAVWFRRARRCLSLAKDGRIKAARSARPDDIWIDADSAVHSAYRGITMDFTAAPYRSLLPSRWPDRPPSTDLDIRMIRREFRSYPDYPDRQLRSLLSHGNMANLSHRRVSVFAAPHMSALTHFAEWASLMNKEVERGWGRVSTEQLAYWPQRLQPSQLAERNGAFRLCHDLSWQSEDSHVLSPNDEDYPIMIVEFVRLHHLGRAIAIQSTSGVQVRVFKFDLSKAYKRTAQQAMSLWHRTTLSSVGLSQTLDRVAFGQGDGPANFSRQTNFFIFIMRNELEYSEACFPTRDPAVVAWQLARLQSAVHAGCKDTARSWMALSFVMAFIDDFAGAVIDDLLFRPDGSVVVSERGRQRRRSWLVFEVATSVVTRCGHLLELDDAAKTTFPACSMLLLGAIFDVPTLSILLDHTKRKAYLLALRHWIARLEIPAARLTSLAFKMLVVCEVQPAARQWLHSIFRALRGPRSSHIVFMSEPGVRESLQSFAQLLNSDATLSIPMACRQTFPFSDTEHLMVIFADASGFDARTTMSSLPLSTDLPGYGAWTVREHNLFYIWGLWPSHVASRLSINVLEFLISFWAEVAFSRLMPNVSHILSYTDNTADEWSLERETPYAITMQLVSERRAAFLAQSSLYIRAGRVTSADNTWADDLSRQRVPKVLHEAAEMSLIPHRIDLSSDFTDLEWLLHRVRA